MPKQPATKNYIVEELLAVGKRWISAEIFMGWIEEYLQAEKARTGKKRRFYQRLLPPLVTMWLMVYQRLHEDHSCDGAMSAYVSGMKPEQMAKVSESNSAYCQARARLPWEVVKAGLKHTAECLRAEMGAARLWCGREVGLLDGSTMRLEASGALHDHYGVSKNQHGENHWPVMRIVAVFHLFTGGVEEAEEAPFEVGEGTMAAHLMRAAGNGWVWVGDMNFGTYRTVQVACYRQQDVVVRIRPDRLKRWIGNRQMVSGEDIDVVWSGKDNLYVEPDLPCPEVEGRLIYLRVEHPGFRPIDVYLFTTLTDRERYPTTAILALYNRRWEVELNLRHLKTTLEMEELDGKSVDIVRKELWVGFLAYSLTRAVMALAALTAHLSPLGLSFACCLRRLLSSLPLLANAHTSTDFHKAWNTLLARLAKCRLPHRKNFRFEPRRVWGKPRVFPTIKISRDHARAEELAKLAPAIS